MKQKLLNSFKLRALMLVAILCAGFTSAWGEEGDEITSISNIEDGKSYYIKGVRSNSTYYLKFTDATGSQSGTESSTIDDAVLITFHSVNGGGYTLSTPNGHFIAPGTSNGKINVSATAITVSASNQNNKIRLSIVSGTNTWSLQKNTGAANFGGYKNTQADITLIEGPSASSKATITTINHNGITNTDVYAGTAAGSLTATVTADGNAVAGATVSWSSSDDDVATISSNGTVTLVGKGTVTFTASYAGVSGEYLASSATYEMTVVDTTPFEGGDITFIGGTDKGTTTTTNADAVTKEVVTISSTSAAFATSEYRLYQNSNTTISTTTGKISKIVFTKNSTYNLSNLSTQTGNYNSSTGTWTGNAESVSFTASAQVRLDKIVVTVISDDAVADPEISGTVNFYNETQVTITCSTEGATIKYSTDNTNWNTYEGYITINATSTIYAKAEKDNKTSSVVSKTFTKVTPITVTQALSTANNSEVYVSGIVSRVSGYYNSKYITYFISADGNQTNELEVYNGLGLNGDSFSSANDIQAGDQVVVYGTLTTYNNTKELAQDNYLISHITKTDPELAFETTEYTVAPDADFTAPTLTNPNALTVTYSSSDEDLALVDENTGEVVIGSDEGTVTITATFDGNENYRAGSASYTITIVDLTKGTETNPYTVAEVIAGKASGKTNIYVVGYIVGEFVGSSQAPRTSDFTTDANMALADAFTTSPTAAASIPVALPTDALKAAWGCKTNNDSKLGTKVIVNGNGTTYFSVDGIKNTTSVTGLEPVTVTSAGFATYCSANALDFTNAGIKAYVGTLSGTALTFTPVTTVPANTGLLLVKDGGATEDIPVAASAQAVQNNCLVGTLVEKTLDAKDYILNVVDGKAGFYLADTYTTLAAHRAYIPALTGGQVKSFAINLDEADAISAVKAVNGNADIFNLAGQRVSKAQKGIYIINGKKVLVK